MIRRTSEPVFWDERYRLPEPPFGAEPNAFLVSEAWRLRTDSHVLDLGAGDGRNALWLARNGHRATALDFSTVGLHQYSAAAAKEHAGVDLLEADLTEWVPERTWDVIVCTFVHLLSEERPRLFRSILDALNPGGLLLAEWFSVDNLLVEGPGPTTPDRLLTLAEIERCLTGGTLLVLRDIRHVLDEGPFIQGPAATCQVAFQKST